MKAGVIAYIHPNFIYAQAAPKTPQITGNDKN